MKKFFKGFTIAECLVAMAILSIACLILGGIEATVARTNSYNHFMNSSLSNQMAYIEKYEDAETVTIENNYTADAPPNDSSNSGDKAYVKITKIKQMSSTDTPSEFDPLSKKFKAENRVADSTYSFPVDIYVMYTRDTEDVGSNESGYSTVASGFSMNGSSEKQGNLRYKYILGAS